MRDETIARMKEGVVIVNAGRGCLIDEDALLRGLESGRVRAAGLDVYAAEPTANSALTSHPRVTCTPHIGRGRRRSAAAGRSGTCLHYR